MSKFLSMIIAAAFAGANVAAVAADAPKKEEKKVEAKAEKKGASAEKKGVKAPAKKDTAKDAKDPAAK